MADSEAEVVRDILRDAFTRLIEHVENLTDGLTPEAAIFRPTPTANSIAWLVWHSARQQDVQLAGIAGTEQVWLRDGWVDRFGLDLPREDMGYGHSPEEVGRVRAPADLLAGYAHAVHKATLAYIASVTPDELSRIVDENWDPPVTAAMRLVSIFDDGAQHLGQAAYIRGIT
ncbi:mycothiol transferase [Mycolicibacterium celeriflavum]|uniref:mycothiol transferase n=1 Tax=Mycolicibacterium celeriflavum TaxID=1249101 RepID=UPI003CF225B6